MDQSPYPVYASIQQPYIQGGAMQPNVVPAPQFTTVGTVAATLTIASAVSIGSNMVEVRNKSMTLSQAVLNGVIKGTAATVILNATARSTTLQVLLAAGVLAGAGYVIDSSMKKDTEERCSQPNK